MKGSRRRAVDARGNVRGRGKTAVWELRVLAGRHPVTGKPRYISPTVTGTAATTDAKLAELVWRSRVDSTTDRTSRSGRCWTAGWRTPQPSRACRRRRSGSTSGPSTRTFARCWVTWCSGPRRQGPDAFYVSHDPPKAAVGILGQADPCSHRRGVQTGRQMGRNGWQDPAQAATAPSVPSATRGAPSVEEVQLLIETAEKDDPDMAAFIALAAITGARRGELCGLRWGDVDEGLGTLGIVRSYAVVNGRHMFSPQDARHPPDRSG